MKQKATWDLVVVGGVNTDYVVQGPRLPSPGLPAEGAVFLEGPGGKGANQAVAAARLEARVALVARVGMDARGVGLLHHLQTERVETRWVVRDPGAPTGAALVMVGQEGEKLGFAAPGAVRRLTADDIQAAAAAIREARVVLVSLEVPLEQVTLALRLGRDAGARVVLDPAPAAPLPDEVLRLTDLIKPDAVEGGILTGLPVTDRRSARRAADQLLGRGVGVVAIQAGGEGNLVVGRGEEHWLPELPVAKVDTNGAGDAFAAALAVALAEGRSLAEAAPFAHAAAALAATALGAQAGLPRREQIRELLARCASAAEPPAR